jgi:hypothetical protein
MSGVTLDGEPQTWALDHLAAQLKTLVYDNGPHSVTRTVLRHDLPARARGTDQRSAALAVRALELLEERGVLLVLAEDGGATGVRATAAYQRVGPPRP